MLIKRRGQAFALDFAMSIAIFLVILVIASKVWLDTNRLSQQSSQGNDLTQKTLTVSDSLLRGQGSPAGWYSLPLSQVTSIGIAETPHVINMTLFNRIKQFNSSSDYAAVEGLLGVSPYNLYVEFNDGNKVLKSGILRGKIAFFSSGISQNFANDFLNGSGLTWDYYYGNDAGGSANFLDSSSQYQGTRVSMFDLMLNNSVQYGTLIVENAQLLSSGINSSKLQNFVNSSGLLILVGDAEFSKTFGYQKSQGSAQGTVTSIGASDFLNSSQGDSYSFSSFGDSVSNNSLTSLSNLVQSSSNSSQALIAEWEYGFGLVYFATGVEGTALGGGGSSIPFTTAMNFVGANLSYGISPVQSSNSIVSQRLVIIDDSKRSSQNLKRRIASMKVVVWT